MKNQKLKIIFVNNHAYLTNEVAIEFNQLNIENQHLINEHHKPSYWTIEVISHNEIENKLFVEILSYDVGRTEFFENQIILEDK